VLREKKRIKSPMPISNKNLANKLYSLLARAKSAVSILSGKGISEIREIINLRHINRQKESFIRQKSQRFLKLFQDLKNLKGCYFWS
jgi:hypothetical protein